ncbi:hypothetical protein HZ994_08755 [Akkermansiaceae bacterium]|nr:hypothetical protein HZ994_08755 [Akkermansiaceae bacterium]
MKKRIDLNFIKNWCRNLSMASKSESFTVEGWMSSFHFTTIAKLMGILLFVGCQEDTRQDKNDRSARKPTPELSRRTQVPESREVRGKPIPKNLNGFSDIKRMIEDMGNQNTAEKWNAAVGFQGSQHERAYLLKIVLSQMCATDGAEAAMGLVTASFGPGDFRDILLMDVFSSKTTSIGDLLALRSKLTETSELASASAGISCAIARMDDLKDLNCIMKVLDADSLPILLNGLGMRIQALVTKGEDVSGELDGALQIAKACDSALGGEGHMVSDLLLKVAEDAPFEVWAILNSDESKTEDSRMLVDVAGLMAKVDPARAMSIVIDSRKPEGIERVFVRWLQFDPKAAELWYQIHLKEFSQPTKDELVSGFAKVSIRTKNLEDARKWAESIVDASARKQIEGEIWTAERDTLRKEASTDPAGTVQAIVSGESNYADYWLEEAMVTWVSKDFNKAQEWYQENWKSLPAEKSQYVAAAFATQAMGQGDTATARQWASYIRNTKTKQRIEAAIAKAERQNGN